MTATYENLELHLSAAPLKRKHVNAIRACCGSYSKCLGYSNRRYVLVPATERVLIDDLVRTYCGYGNKVTMIARGTAEQRCPSWVVVQEVNALVDSPTEHFAQLFAKSYVQATARGLIR
jgi:hypothetical protein